MTSQPDPVPSRLDPLSLRTEAEVLLSAPLLQLALDALGGFVLVLTPSRQILAASQDLLAHLGLEGDELARGLRPGDVLGCVNAQSAAQGCHTAPECIHCGAFVALRSALERDLPTQGECHIECRRGGQYSLAEFRIRVTPLHLEGHLFLVVVLQDISNERRKHLLERAFLHDLANTLMGLQAGLAQPRGGTGGTAQRLVDLVRLLGEELSNHRLILETEEGRLDAQSQAVHTSSILCDLEIHFQDHPAAHGRVLEAADFAQAGVVTDPVLLFRVLSNMITNAFEATKPGGVVQVASRSEGHRIRFEVHNDGLVPETLRGRLFRQVVSTKPGPARGLGTYAMRLIGEEILHGKVGFTSEPGHGTTFYISIPV